MTVFYIMYPKSIILQRRIGLNLHQYFSELAMGGLNSSFTNHYTTQV